MLLASASIEARLLDVAARLVRPAPPHEEGKQVDDQQERTPELELHYSGKIKGSKNNWASFFRWTYFRPVIDVIKPLLEEI